MPAAMSKAAMAPTAAAPMPNISARGPDMGRGRGENFFRKILPSCSLELGIASSNWKPRSNGKACEDVSCGRCENPRRRMSECKDAMSSGYEMRGLSRSTSQKAVVIAPPACPDAPVASADVSSSSQPLNNCTSARVWNGFVSSRQPRAVWLKGRSMPVPLWQQSITAVSRTPSGKGLTTRSLILSSVIIPACSKSTGRMVSCIPSSSKPFGSSSWAPCPEKWKNKASPGSASSASQPRALSIFARVGASLPGRSSVSTTKSLAPHPSSESKDRRLWTSLMQPRNSARVPK
mmetsp:Transcript_50782/g.146511  ORF Transcript_50782/g.146511 Transcript_50782/m.146511 type:complete len:291 (+) Transcript_50782:205-1077(+)